MTQSYKKKIKKAVFPVAGLGTRFHPITKTIPKEMLPIGSRPIIQYILEEAVRAGIEEFIFITNSRKEAVVNFFDNCGVEKHQIFSIPDESSIITVRQREPMGLGHAILCARKIIGNEPFAVLLPDEMFMLESGISFLSQMIEEYDNLSKLNKKLNVVGIAKININDSNRYGIVDIDYNDENVSNVMKIKGMLEKPKPKDAPSNISITGRYILQPEIFDFLEKKNIGHNGEVQLTDSMDELLNIQDFYGCLLEGDRFDTGSYEGFLTANIAFAVKEKSISPSAKTSILKFLK